MSPATDTKECKHCCRRQAPAGRAEIFTALADKEQRLTIPGCLSCLGWIGCSLPLWPVMTNEASAAKWSHLCVITLWSSGALQQIKNSRVIDAFYRLKRDHINHKKKWNHQINLRQSRCRLAVIVHVPEPSHEVVRCCDGVDFCYSWISFNLWNFLHLYNLVMPRMVLIILLWQHICFNMSTCFCHLSLCPGVMRSGIPARWSDVFTCVHLFIHPPPCFTSSFTLFFPCRLLVCRTGNVLHSQNCTCFCP